MLLGLLLTYGIQPGPTIITDHLDLMYLIVWSFAIASVLGAALCFGGTRYLARLTTVPFAVLGPGLVVIMLLGAFQESGQLGDLWVMIALGVFGWLLKATDYPRAPFLIGFVLAVPLERYYFLTVNVYDGASWLLRPWVLVFLLILIAPAVLAVIRRIRARRHTDVDDTERAAPPSDDEGQLTNTGWSLAIALGMLAVFTVGWFVSAGFTPEARLVPRLLCTGGIVVALVLVGLELKARRTARTRNGDPHDEGTSSGDVAEHEAILTGQPVGELTSPGAVAVAEPRTETRRELVLTALRMFAWMIAFLVLVTIGGYLAALLLFIPAFLLFVARARPRTVIIYTVVVALFILALPALIHIDLPVGLLAALG
jgi:putative tricarboxylic transport membrane protein